MKFIFLSQKTLWNLVLFWNQPTPEKNNFSFPLKTRQFFAGGIQAIGRWYDARDCCCCVDSVATIAVYARLEPPASQGVLSMLFSPATRH